MDIMFPYFQIVVRKQLQLPKFVTFILKKVSFPKK